MSIIQQYPITGMNIEVTTACPLHCPQCYCTLEGARNIPLELAVRFLLQGKSAGLKHVELSGGETLCYPHLVALIKEANKLDLETSITISGVGLTESYLMKLQDAGLSKLNISLNGPTEELNKKTRDGFKYSIAALEMAQNVHFPNVYLNWVMHRSVADYLPQMIEIAKKYDVKTIVVMMPKPTSRNELNTLPTIEQMKNVAEIIKKEKPGTIGIETCFSPLLAMVKDTKLLGNLNIGILKGCGVGLRMVSISVDGRMMPCRHLEYYETWNSIQEYWELSPFLKKIRSLDKTGKKAACSSCRYTNYCRPCLAINDKLFGEISFEQRSCALSVDPLI